MNKIPLYVIHNFLTFDRKIYQLFGVQLGRPIRLDGFPRFHFVHKLLQDGTPQQPAMAKGHFVPRDWKEKREWEGKKSWLLVLLQLVKKRCRQRAQRIPALPEPIQSEGYGKPVPAEEPAMPHEELIMLEENIEPVKDIINADKQVEEKKPNLPHAFPTQNEIQRENVKNEKAPEEITKSKKSRCTEEKRVCSTAVI